MFRLALRQTEELIGSVLQLLGLDLPVPDHNTLSRRAETLEVPRPKAGSAPVHLLVVYRPRLVRHLVGAYAALAAGGSCSARMAAGGRKPCRSMSQVVL